MNEKFAHVSIAEYRQSLAGIDLTTELGCLDTRVRVYHCKGGEAIRLDGSDDHLCVPIAGTGTMKVDPEQSVGTDSIAAIHAVESSEVQVSGELSFCVVSAPSRQESPRRPVTVSLDACEYVVPDTSDVAIAWLTEPLALTGMKVNVRRLVAGQRVPYHTEGEQEELFVPVRGPASMVIDGTPVETPVGTIVRVAPPIPRSAVNDGDEEALWVMIGAPPTGEPTGWDPGSEILDAPG